PGLKTVEDAVDMRRRILLTFELAERRTYLTGNHKEINFVVVGGGPTGVELAGAIADIARQALSKDFMAIDTTKSHVLLFEGSDRVLGTFPKDLSESAKKQLEDLGVEVHLNSLVTDIQPGKVKVADRWIDCDVVLWATGVAASSLGTMLGETDRAGRVHVSPDLSLPDNENIFVIGDMASIKQKNGEPVPGLAPAAMQMGSFAAAMVLADQKGMPRRDFNYVDKGTMATIGRRRAIADIRGWKFSGFIAWLMWTFLHVLLLIGFRNRFAVMFDWAWAYLTRERSARLITGGADELKDALAFIAGPTAVVAVDKLNVKKVDRAAG
ncbi:MAG TPA: FAD-dependent oxidoreductase, partial [Pyrinomonadaceae bacterium]|nr:FAD-dependent oxidoreductase [Pyrinomonadaceae bacterium]